MTEKLLNPSEVAELLGVSKSWVNRAAASGELPCLQLGRHRRFRREILDEWLRKKAGETE